MTEPPAAPDMTAELNRRRGGLNQAIGLRFVSASPDEVVGEIEIGPQHLQPYGIVHGGVYSAMVETLASVGAALNLSAQARHTVGLDNHTSFLRAVRSGTLVGRALPLTRGRRTHLWEVQITQAGELVATGRVRLLGIEHDATLAGQVVSLS